MSTVPLDNPTGDALVFDTPAGLVPAVAEADPSTGAPADRATETTLAALKTVADTLATAAAAIQSAVEALNGKTTAVNTGAIVGTVALDAGSLAALETVNANTGLAQPLTDAQLRAAEVPVSGPITDAELRASEVPVVDDVVANFLHQMLMILQSPAAFDLSLNRLRQTAIIESGNITSIDGRNGAMAINALDHTAWALNVGASIT